MLCLRMHIVGDTLGETYKTSKTFTILFVSMTGLSSFCEWDGEHAFAAGTVKTGCNFKINSKYFLGATFVFDSLSCVLSQFTGTAWVRHSSLSQHSRSVSIHLSHCLSFGEIRTNKWYWQLSFSAYWQWWAGGVVGGMPIDNNNNINAK